MKDSLGWWETIPSGSNCEFLAHVYFRQNFENIYLNKYTKLIYVLPSLAYPTISVVGTLFIIDVFILLSFVLSLALWEHRVRQFTIAKLSIRKFGSSSVLIIMRLI